MRTVLHDLLGCRYPVIQSPMTWVANTSLAAAASRAGAFGIFASTSVRTGEVDASVRAIQEQTDQPFGVYATGLQPNLSEVVEAVLRNRVRGFCYGRGVGAETLARLKAAGVVCMTNVGAPRHAAKAVELGADLVMVQGGEGGGHTGAVSTIVLLPQVLEAVRVPVVAAGGFFEGRGLAAALAAGAAGIAMGTRFMLSRESPVAAEAKAHYLAQHDGAAVRTTTALDGLPQRVIVNDLIRDMEATAWPRQMALALRSAWQWKSRDGVRIVDFLNLLPRIAKQGPSQATRSLRMARLPELLQRGLGQGDVARGLLPAGQAATAISKVTSCDEIVREIVRVADLRLAQLSRDLAVSE